MEILGNHLKSYARTSPLARGGAMGGLRCLVAMSVPALELAHLPRGPVRGPRGWRRESAYKTMISLKFHAKFIPRRFSLATKV